MSYETAQEMYKAMLPDDVLGADKITNIVETIFERATEAEVLALVLELLEETGIDTIKVDDIYSKSEGDDIGFHSPVGFIEPTSYAALATFAQILAGKVMTQDLEVELITGFDGEDRVAEIQVEDIIAGAIEVDDVVTEFFISILTATNDLFADFIEAFEEDFITVNSEIYFTEFDRYGTEKDIVATGTVVGDAYQLTKKLNWIADSVLDSGVVLPEALIGRKIDVLGGSTNSVKMYAGVGDNLVNTDYTSQAAFTINLDNVYECICFEDGYWTCFRNK